MKISRPATKFLLGIVAQIFQRLLAQLCQPKPTSQKSCICCQITRMLVRRCRTNRNEKSQWRIVFFTVPCGHGVFLQPCDLKRVVLLHQATIMETGLTLHNIAHCCYLTTHRHRQKHTDAKCEPLASITLLVSSF